MLAGMTAGELLREARRRAGLTQREVAARAGTSQPAIAAIERFRPNLVLTDWRFGGVTAQALLDHGDCARSADAAPVIVMATAEDRFSQRRFEDLGASDTLCKPLRAQRLREVCHAAIVRSEWRRQASAGAARAAFAGGALSLVR